MSGRLTSTSLKTIVTFSLKPSAHSLHTTDSFSIYDSLLSSSQFKRTNNESIKEGVFFFFHILLPIRDRFCWAIVLLHLMTCSTAVHQFYTTLIGFYDDARSRIVRAFSPSLPSHELECKQRQRGLIKQPNSEFDAKNREQRAWAHWDRKLSRSIDDGLQMRIKKQRKYLISFESPTRRCFKWFFHASQFDMHENWFNFHTNSAVCRMLCWLSMCCSS